MKVSRMKRLAIGAAVVGAFVAGSVLGAKKGKAKSLLKKGVRKVKSDVRKVRAASRAKVVAIRDEMLD